jgi:MOSC domain-containing protein YiiM
MRYYGKPYDIEEHFRRIGTGDNNLRTARLAQPRALQVGDILATGSKILSPPRDGGNGLVWLHLTGGYDGHWLEVQGRIPLAIMTPEDGVPFEIQQRFKRMAHIVAIFIAPEAGAPMEEVAEVEVGIEFGLNGDRYGAGRGSWSTPGKTHRQVSFIEYEVLSSAQPFTLSDARRNIVTYGIKLNDQIGKEIRVRGPQWKTSVSFRGTKLCEPCERPRVLGLKKVSFVKAIGGQLNGGLCATVISNGVIRVGQDITVD